VKAKAALKGNLALRSIRINQICPRCISGSFFQGLTIKKLSAIFAKQIYLRLGIKIMTKKFRMLAASLASDFAIVFCNTVDGFDQL